MIIYQENKSTFMTQVRENDIEYIINEQFKQQLGYYTSKNEVNSWKNSLQYMRNVLDDAEIPSDATISIECRVPNTSKRIDFIISGQNDTKQDCAVIIELKQWENASLTNLDGVVQTFVGSGNRMVSHPSYQAWSYVSLLQGFNESVYNGEILLQPCAFLHNCSDASDLRAPFYQEYLDKAPLFIKRDLLKLSDFIKQFIKYGDPTNIMYRIEHGKIRPSKTIADAIVGMLKGNEEFVMIDDQKVVFENVLQISKIASESKKQVVIVKGGPGTGKSVIAVQLTAKLTSEERLVQYVSKNRAPRDVYASKLNRSHKKTWVNNLFKSSGSYLEALPNQFDALIVDEAHRLNEKSGLYSNLGENQIKEIIVATKCAVFFIDEDQRVTINDIGTEKEIEKWAKKANAEITYMQLESQFRCNGSDGYLAWLDNMLQIRPTANDDIQDLGYEFYIANSPNELRDRIEHLNKERNRARIVAGYCWPWNSKKDKKAMDIVIPEYQFSAQWNLVVDGSMWIVNPDSVQEIGCIHTCQGLEVDHIGVIIGPDMVVRDNKWVCRSEFRAQSDKSVFGLKKMIKSDSDKGKQIADMIIKNTYRTLMTRGMKSCTVWSEDVETLEWLKRNVVVKS